jgi:hypothetical protein
MIVGACSTTIDVAEGVRQRGDYLFLYDGPELVATIGTHQSGSSLGENWLVLGAQLRAASRAGVQTIDRSAISVRTPDGRRLPLISQEEFLESFGEIHAVVRRTEFNIPATQTFEDDYRYCDRWFFAEIGKGFAVEELHISSFEVCSGPLVFRAPRGVQPGRWRLVIELEESTADIPFEVEDSR